MVADAFSKYEYEVFTGEVVSTKSEALQVGASVWGLPIGGGVSRRYGHHG